MLPDNKCEELGNMQDLDYFDGRMIVELKDIIDD